MSRIPTHTLESAPVATRPVLETLAQRSPSGKPINLHAQMAHAPALLLGYMAMRKALDDYGTLDRNARTAILLAVAAADESAYTIAVNTLVAKQAGWDEEQTLALRQAASDDPKLTALLAVARQATLNHGHVDEPTWQAARAAGWAEADLAEAFAFVGLTQYVDAFVNFARTELDPALAQGAPQSPPRDDATRLTHPRFSTCTDPPMSRRWATRSSSPSSSASAT
jgi:hypothetical protein